MQQKGKKLIFPETPEKRLADEVFTMHEENAAGGDAGEETELERKLKYSPWPSVQQLGRS